MGTMTSDTAQCLPTHTHTPHRAGYKSDTSSSHIKNHVLIRAKRTEKMAKGMGGLSLSHLPTYPANQPTPTNTQQRHQTKKNLNERSPFYPNASWQRLQGL